ncbi:MAG: Cj0069 family protein [Deltaproteobacteria bacterium]|nr:Cj0069 family protein [Deltaproteobacteria bacterium]
MRNERAPTVGLLYPGDLGARRRSDPSESRFAELFRAFANAGLHAEPAIYHDDFTEEVRAQLLRLDGVLVWHNPIEGGRRRDRLDALLREVAEAGVFVSAHPETIQRLGTKDVLLDVRDLPFGSDVHRVDGVEQLRVELPGRLRAGPRVLKQHRGQSGVGVWRVALDQSDPRGRSGARLELRHAERGSEAETIDLETLLERLRPYFEPEHGGHLVDQAWQPRLVDGMVRAYLVGDRVAGFGHQAVNALYPASPGQPAPPPGPRFYHGPELERFQSLRRRLEEEWIGRLASRVGLRAEELPLLWDMDFFHAVPTEEDADPFALCEINVSSVAPFPPSAIDPLVEETRKRLSRAR